MGYLTVFGCLLLAFGPSMAFFSLVLAKRATLVILAIGAGFFWLCGMFFASMVWVVPPVRDSAGAAVFFSVLMTELFRFLYWLLWTNGHQSLNQDAGKRLQSETMLRWEAVAAGVGSGFCSSLMYAGLLWQAWGPGVLSNPRCFGLSVFLIGAVLCLLWNCLHVAATVVAHEAYRSRNKVIVVVVAVSHFGLAMVTGLNAGQTGESAEMCAFGLGLEVIVVALAAYGVIIGVKSRKW